MDVVKATNVAEYKPKKIVVKTPEEEKEAAANGNQAAEVAELTPDDEDLINKTLARLADSSKDI